MYKLIACDIDETLCENGMIVKENIEAIKHYIQQGGKFVLATGRARSILHPILKELELWGLQDQYVLANNGALLLSCKDLNCIKKISLSKQMAQKLFDFGKQFEVGIQIFTPDTLYVYRLNEEEQKRFISYGVQDYVIIHSFDEIKDVDIIKMIYENADLTYLQEIMKQIPNEWKQWLSLSFSSSRYLEINDKSVDKGKALEDLAQSLGIKQEEVIAIGDHYNDLSMITYAGLGVCVANGQEEVKKVANYITKQDAFHGAVAEVIHRFALGK